MWTLSIHLWKVYLKRKNGMEIQEWTHLNIQLLISLNIPEWKPKIHQSGNKIKNRWVYLVVKCMLSDPKMINQCLHNKRLLHCQSLVLSHEVIEVTFGGTVWKCKPLSFHVILEISDKY